MKPILNILLLLSVTSLSVAGPAEDAARYYEDGLARYQEKAYPAAVIQAKNALQLVPDHLPARILLGETLLEQGKGADAEKELELAHKMGADPGLILLPLAKALNRQRKYHQVVERIPEYGLPFDLQGAILFERGRALLELGQLVEARSQFELALSVQKGAVLPVIGLAMVELNEGSFEAAEKTVEKALLMAPDNAEVWHAKGAIAYAQGQLEQAVEHYSEALSLQPDYYTAKVSRASTYMDLGRFSDAVVELKQLRRTRSQDPQVSYLLSIALKKIDDASGSKRELQHAAGLINSIQPGQLTADPQILLLAGLISYDSGEMEAAYKHLDAYLRVDRDNFIALKLQGATLLAMQRHQQAVRALKHAVSLAPDNAETFELLGDAYLQMGNYVYAIDSYKRAGRLAPDQPGLLAKLGVSHFSVNKKDAAVDQLEAALRGRPDAAGTAEVLAAVYLSLGNNEKARDVADNLVQLQPENPTASNLLATAYLNLGRPDLARQWYFRALEINPTFLPARINLANLDLREGRIAEARQSLELIVREEPENLRALTDLARLEKVQGNSDKALNLLKKAHEMDRRAAAPALKLIDFYLEAGDAPAALEVAQELLSEYPDNAIVLEAVGRTQLALAQPAEARLAFKKAAYLVGYDSNRLYRLARLQMRAGGADDARWSLQKAIEGDAAFLPAQLALIDLQIETGRLEDAAALIEKQKQNHPQHPAVYRLSGDLAMRNQTFGQAVDAYAKALEIQDTPDLVIRLFRAQAASGEYDAALAFLSDWVDRHPEGLAPRRLLAEVHHGAGRLQQARYHYEWVLSRSSEDATLLNNLANLYTDLGDPRALEFAQRAYEIDPSRAGVVDTLGWLLVQSGQTEKGLDLLRDAAARDIASPEIRYHLAVALQDLGRRDGAVRELRIALKSDAQFSGREDAERRLEILDAASGQ